jgi:lysine 2,3-aminomutase
VADAIEMSTMTALEPDVGQRRSSARTGTLRSPQALAEAGLIARDRVPLLDAVAARYTVAVPATLAALIDVAEPEDPIARQLIPDPRELITRPEERLDPIGDEAFSPVRGVTHRYPDRVLLRPLLSCPLYCRFCFRREVVGRSAGSLTPAELDAALDYIASTSTIREVILTGGDPLLLSARRLGELLARLSAMPHVETLRIHTRVPIATPDVVTAQLLRALRPSKPVWLAVHVNHVRELGDGASAALARLADQGIPLLAQTVLLRGVNDQSTTLADLFRRLVALRVKPYYLHHPDLAPGTGHFRVSLAEGRSIYAALRGHVSGHALPTYVLDIPGGAGKVPVEAPWVDVEPDGGWRVLDRLGERHRYETWSQTLLGEE